MNKMREEFERVWAESRCDDDGLIGNKPTRSTINADCYSGGAAQFAWIWWQRSRAALCVELPENCKGMALTVDEFHKQLDKAGVSHKQPK